MTTLELSWPVPMAACPPNIISRAHAAVPPTAKLETVEWHETYLQITYRYPGLAKATPLRVQL